MNLCPIWQTPADSKLVGHHWAVESVRTNGLYRMSDTVAHTADFKDIEFRAKLTTWLVRRRLAGDQSPMINSDVIRAVRAQSRLTTSARLDRFWQWLVSRTHVPGRRIRLGGEEAEATFNGMFAWMECEGRDDWNVLMSILRDDDLITLDIQDIHLTSKGWAKLEESERGGTHSRHAFVAMWFSSETEAAYDNGIESAIRRAGYEPLRIDRVEHNRKIDDEIIASIKRARFIVADFTCGVVNDGSAVQAVPRGGVYFEAGYALGLGIEVIWTCRKDQIDAVHFDTNHFAHILWETPQQLADALYNRICAVVGLGPGVRVE